MTNFDKYDHKDIKPSKAKKALNRLHHYITMRGDSLGDGNKDEHAYGVLLMCATDFYKALKKYLEDTPLCHYCDGAGFTVAPDAKPGCADEYSDCNCGQELSIPVLTPAQKTYLEMHTLLGRIKNSGAWDGMDTVLQDEITKAHKAGEKWL